MKFNIVQKLTFFVYLLFYKLIAPLECYNYRLTILFNEIGYFAAHIFPSLKLIYQNEKILLKTRCGDFFIRKIWPDLTIASPSFERTDIVYLNNLIGNRLKKRKKVMFVDIGAGFGKYSVSIGRKWKSNDHLELMAFEPFPENFSLLKRNIQINKLSSVRIFQSVLSNKNGFVDFYINDQMKMFTTFKSGSKKIKLKAEKLNSFSRYFSKFDEIFIKLDVEGHETEVLQGASKILRLGKRVVLLVEDGIDKRLPNYLLSNFIFLSKQSIYNSFWEIQPG
ncbi:MAG: FkbM family methyltransferase [Candidatus Daviesbacteria bacterium]|nr:FkbM family methyltransferase [Candidatus Daviesbacteria bacterium]